MTTIDDVLAEAKAARLDLADLEFELQEEIDRIRFDAASSGRAMTEEERNLRNQLRAEKSELRDAFVQLTFVTLQRLDSAPEIAQLNARMAAVNQDLQDDLAHLKEIAEFAALAARISEGIAGIAAKVASMVA